MFAVTLKTVFVAKSTKKVGNYTADSELEAWISEHRSEALRNISGAVFSCKIPKGGEEERSGGGQGHVRVKGKCCTHVGKLRSASFLYFLPSGVL